MAPPVFNLLGFQSLQMDIKVVFISKNNKHIAKWKSHHNSFMLCSNAEQMHIFTTPEHPGGLPGGSIRQQPRSNVKPFDSH